MPRANRHPSRVIVYCHDTFGMGNARRMMAISTHLAEVFPRANVLLASGSPVIHGFRMPARLDYIKLPSITRTHREQSAARTLTTTLADTIHLRSSILRAAVRISHPISCWWTRSRAACSTSWSTRSDVTHKSLRGTKHILILRDILDAPEATMPYLAESGFEPP